MQEFTKDILANHDKTNSKHINYDTIIKTIGKMKKYSFLNQIVPEKITYSDYLAKKKK